MNNDDNIPGRGRTRRAPVRAGSARGLPAAIQKAPALRRTPGARPRGSAARLDAGARAPRTRPRGRNICREAELPPHTRQPLHRIAVMQRGGNGCLARKRREQNMVIERRSPAGSTLWL